MNTECPICGSALEFDDIDHADGTQRGDGVCPDCLWTPNDDPRERHEDDGREYADPRDYRDGLE